MVKRFLPNWQQPILKWESIAYDGEVSAKAEC
jgi:hypothetical protein